EDLADHARGIEPGEPGKVHTGLGLPHALQHAAGPGPQRKDVPRPAKIRRVTVTADGHVDGARAVARRDAGGDAELPLRIDADGERGAQLLGVPLGHLREAELVTALRGERKADEPAPVDRHEIDHLRRDELGRADEITLGLAVFIVRYDDDLPAPQVVDGLVDRAECHPVSAFTYVPMVSASRCTRSPGRRKPSVVARKVNGMSETWMRPGSEIALTVRLTPSTVIEPRGMVTAATPAGTRMSRSRASSRSATASTVPTPSTCPWTRWPPRRSPTRSARSRFTASPGVNSRKRVRSSEVRTTCALNSPELVAVTVRHAPSTATLSPRPRSSYGAAIVRSSPPSGPGAARRTSPTAVTIPVNMAPGRERGGCRPRVRAGSLRSSARPTPATPQEAPTRR